MGMPRDYVRIDEEQFAKLVELLTPGYELARAYMADMQQRQAAQAQHDAEGAARAEAAQAEAAKADTAKAEAAEKAKK